MVRNVAVLKCLKFYVWNDLQEWSKHADKLSRNNTLCYIWTYSTSIICLLIMVRVPGKHGANPMQHMVPGWGTLRIDAWMCKIQTHSAELGGNTAIHSASSSQLRGLSENWGGCTLFENANYDFAIYIFSKQGWHNTSLPDYRAKIKPFSYHLTGELMSHLQKCQKKYILSQLMEGKGEESLILG